VFLEQRVHGVGGPEFLYTEAREFFTHGLEHVFRIHHESIS
jgi:hypothetical protein